MKVKDKFIYKRKAQSILEYLTVLTAIVIVICAHTFWHFTSFSSGIEVGLNDMGQAVEDTVDQDLDGEAIDVEAEAEQWYVDNPLSE